MHSYTGPSCVFLHVLQEEQGCGDWCPDIVTNVLMLLQMFSCNTYGRCLCPAELACMHAPVCACAGKLKEHEVKRAIELRNIVTSLGPAYIKLGQVRHSVQCCWCCQRRW